MTNEQTNVRSLAFHHIDIHHRTGLLRDFLSPADLEDLLSGYPEDIQQALMGDAYAFMAIEDNLIVLGLKGKFALVYDARLQAISPEYSNLEKLFLETKGKDYPAWIEKIGEGMLPSDY